MALNYTITSTVATPAVSTGCVRLLHGGLAEGVFSIVNYGLNRKKAVVFGGTGEFWSTYDPSRAVWFAESVQGVGQKAILGYDLPAAVLEQCLTDSPYPQAVFYEPADYEFSATGFSVLNRAMTNITVTLLEQQ